MSVPNVDVSAWVPGAMLSDIKKILTFIRDRKDTDIIIFIPLDDFGPMMLDIQGQLNQKGLGYMPFTPTVLGSPVAPHDKMFIGIQSRPYGTHSAPVLFDVSNGEHEVK